MKLTKSISVAVLLLSIKLGLSGCATATWWLSDSNDSVTAYQSESQSPDETPSSQPTTSESLNVPNSWFTEHFEPKPAHMKVPRGKEDLYFPKDLQGVALPTGTSAQVTVWQAVGCVPIPFSVAGPEVATAKDGVISVSGWEKTEQGAIFAAHSLFSAALESREIAIGTAQAMGISEGEASSLIRKYPAVWYHKSQYQDANPADCGVPNALPGAAKIGKLEDTTTVSYFLPVESVLKGVWFDISVRWDETAKDWRLMPESFAELQKLYDSLESESIKIERFDDSTDFFYW